MRQQSGFAFALPRLVVRLSGREVCRAQWSGLEANGVSLLVFGITWVCAGSALPLFVRPGVPRLVLFAVLPVMLWIGFLLVYYLISLLIRPFRRFRLYSAVTNVPIQHQFFVSLTTLLSFLLLRSDSGWLQSLGILWLGLLVLNLISMVIERLLDRA